MLTAGESHGPALVGILEGLPAGVPLALDDLQRDLRRRRVVAGRSGRQRIEDDGIQVLGGVRHGRTIGSPVALLLANRDHARWGDVMSTWPVVTGLAEGRDPGDDDPSTAARRARVTAPRPGHADLAGMKKLDLDDARDVLERASARETAMRTALGAVCRTFLRALGIEVGSHVLAIGAVRATGLADGDGRLSLQEADGSPVRCLDGGAEQAMLAAIEEAQARGDTLGGTFEVVATGLPFGLGHYAHADRRLSARLAAALASIPSVKEVSFGAPALESGRRSHDGIASASGARTSNRAGGLEGGLSNGMPLCAQVTTKPLSTVRDGLPSVDATTGAAVQGHVERSDVCAVPAAAVVGEAVTCLVLADALLEKFGGDTLGQVRAHVAQSGRYP
jgi:chorismate synthase